jgi:hypothetical protein
MLMYLAKLVRVMPKISSRREVIYRKANAVTWPFNRTEGKVRLSTAPRQSLPDSTRHFNERALANKIKINLIRLARHFSRSVSVRHTRTEKCRAALGSFEAVFSYLIQGKAHQVSGYIPHNLCLCRSFSRNSRRINAREK